MQGVTLTIQEGQANANRLYGTVETHLALATYADTWEWKEVEQSPVSPSETISHLNEPIDQSQ